MGGVRVEDGDGDEGGRGEMSDDEDDDGRGLVSAGWGTGHDGSAIEVLNVQFVEKSRYIPALRTRSQRLMEYAERRAGVLGISPPCARGPTARLAGRKRRRGWDWPLQHFRHLPNATVLDVVPEQDEETDASLSSPRPDDENVADEDMRMNVHTVVFGFGPGGDVQAGYKYDPVVLKGILFPGAEEDHSRPKKRRKLDTAENPEAVDVEMEDPSSPLSYPKTRPVILETAKESYLLSPSGSSGGPHVYDIALVLEAELEEELVLEVHAVAAAFASADPQLVKSTVVGEGAVISNPAVEATSGKDTTTIGAISPTIQPATSLGRNNALPVVATDASVVNVSKETTIVDTPHPTKAVDSSSPPEILPSSRRASLVYGDPSKPLLLQTLQRDLGEDMFRFLKEGVKVADGLGEDGVQTEWMVQVRRWKWGPVRS